MVDECGVALLDAPARPNRGRGDPLPEGRVDPLAELWWTAEAMWNRDLPDEGDETPAWDDQPSPWAHPDGLAAFGPGPDLARALDALDLGAAGEPMVVETVAAWERLAAWAHLGAMLAAAELSRRDCMNPAWALPRPAVQNVAGDELAFRLGWSKRSSYRLVRDGRALENELLLTAEAVREGRLDTARLRTLTGLLADRPGELAWAVQEAVLPGADTRTPTQLGSDVERALLQVCPEDAASRLGKAAATRRVCHPKRLPDGMAGIWAVVPADDAARADATLDASARAARALGSPLTLDQLRADTFVGLLTGTALLAGASAPAVESRTATLRDGQGRARGGPRAARHEVGCDRIESDDADPCESRHDVRSGEGLVEGPTATADVRRPCPPVRIPRVRIDVRVDLTTLLGMGDEPAELAGYGPISAQQARRLAFDAGATWRRLVTDPASGAVLDVGRSRYRPPAAIAEHVLARDGCCAGPGCSTPADRCDLDHTTEYFGTPANGSLTPGTTSAGNLGPLSSRCHRLKTDGGFTLRQVAPGVFEWTTPAGLAYRVTPGDHGRVEPLTRLPIEPHLRYPETPPF